ncbi:hypothetical protein D9M73_142800 [compost metagenome]
MRSANDLARSVTLSVHTQQEALGIYDTVELGTLYELTVVRRHFITQMRIELTADPANDAESLTLRRLRARPEVGQVATEREPRCTGNLGRI